jgi:integrase
MRTKDACGQLISVNFNLRVPKSKQPTPIYMVVGVDGVQHKIPVGAKILPNQWDRRKQQPVINTMFSNASNANAKYVNERISMYRLVWFNYYNYICAEKKQFNLNTLKEQIYDIDMSASEQFKTAKRSAAATTLIDRGLKLYLEKKNLSEGSKDRYIRYTNAWKKWLIDNKLNSANKGLSQNGVNKYVTYLSKTNSASTLNSKFSVFVTLINKFIIPNTQYGLTPVIYTQAVDKRTKEDSKKVEISDTEINKLKDLQLDNERDILYRNVILLGFATGQRISDLYNLVKWTNCSKNDKTIFVYTKKRQKNSIIVVTQEITDLLNTLVGKINVSYFTFKNNTNYYIKKFFKQAQINRVIAYKTARGVRVKDKLCDIISIHYARHTFITKQLRLLIESHYQGDVYEVVGNMVGDTPDQIRATYSHLTKEDKAQQIHNAINSVTKQQTVQQPTQPTQQPTPPQQVQQVIQPIQNIPYNMSKKQVDNIKQCVEELSVCNNFPMIESYKKQMIKLLTNNDSPLLNEIDNGVEVLEFDEPIVDTNKFNEVIDNYYNTLIAIGITKDTINEIKSK